MPRAWGEEQRGRQMFDRTRRFGFAMTDPDAADCFAYRAVRSVVDQVATDRIACEPGTPPPWPTQDPNARDDPRTDVVEGTTTPVPTS
ncbi:hypothetical protein [Lentzea sp. NPDC003310]|uniref:hypothetical protein n=1 Tax=Lentzea sp. NPDC003310 TaxID=3154447 RepID=UPI0033AD75BA